MGADLRDAFDPCWADLRHAGMLLSPLVLAELATLHVPPLSDQASRSLGGALRDLLASDEPTAEQMNGLLDRVLEQGLGYDQGWSKGSSVHASWGRKLMTGELLKPRRIWQGTEGEILPVFVTSHDIRLGIGKGRREVAKPVEWLRKVGSPFALLTNGRQWRLVYAGAEHDAYVEWDIEGWLDAAALGARFDGFRRLIGHQALRVEPGQESALLSALKASRKGQAELSQVLGERVRLAVEHLIRAQSKALDEARDLDFRSIYLAACRIIMRLVVILFAEARDLLPRSNPQYYESYGLEALRRMLERSGSASQRQSMFGAWPRLLALFRLIYDGSSHRDLSVKRYGGTLFEPGNSSADNALERALATLESTEDLNDQVVGDILDLLSRTHLRVRQGRNSAWVAAPIDFSGLSSEYIGILYEGLLDFELHRVAEDPVVILNLGSQPALALSRLEALDDKSLKGLVDSLHKGARVRIAEGPDDSEADDDMPPQAEGGAPLSRGQAFERTRKWAERAVRVGKLLSGRNLEDPEMVSSVADSLVSRVLLPGEWYLLRWGGTRKGSGSFYTRPQLAIPTVTRTLRPLAYRLDSETEGEGVLPRLPEDILAVKVCDPSMGSGSFLVAALRYLTEALLQSLYAHGRIARHGRETVVTLAAGESSHGDLTEETLGLPPDHEYFDEYLRARLQRHIVENCLYGVDFDPLAVELGRMALWIETMDRDLPFSFLDHKLKVGNSLVGAWFDSFEHYPVLAWERDGADKGHKGIHFQADSCSKAIKTKRNEVKREMVQWFTKGLNWLREDRVSTNAERVHRDACAVMQKLHALPVHFSEQRAEIYRSEIEQNPAMRRLRRALDTWCSIWFWPADRLDIAPMPLNFLDPPEETMAVIDEMARDHRFFHWELEFPDVFIGLEGGFDAILGNPPWEIQKPNSREFFSNVDALYRSYGKQDALKAQARLFQADARLEADWLAYNAGFKAMANWMKNAGQPFGDGLNGGESFAFGQPKVSDAWHRQWIDERAKASGYADPVHPFLYQGSGDPNTYKMFLELGHALMKPNGLMGVIVPSGLYSDKGTMELRRLFFERCRWQWLFGFENRQRIFQIHGSFKFCVAIVQKGGSTHTLRTAFSRQDLTDWERAEAIAVPYAAEQIGRLSPQTGALLEIRNEQDLAILNTMYDDAVLLGDETAEGWGIGYATEFHMTSDSGRFAPRSEWQQRGYRPDSHGRWVMQNRVAIPLYEGKMFNRLDYCASTWDGLAWVAAGRPRPAPGPRYLMALEEARRSPGFPRLKVLVRDIARSTDKRTCIATLGIRWPCGNTAATLMPANPLYTFALAGLLSSFALDMAARIRLAGLHLNYCTLSELPLPRMSESMARHFIAPVIRLALNRRIHPDAWLIARRYDPALTPYEAESEHERLRLHCIVDALAAAAYGLSIEQYAAILHVDPSDSKGFWRVDQDKPIQLRHPTLAVEAFKDLTARGLDAFVAQNESEGWMLPDFLDIGGEYRPVGSQLGPRYLEGQLAQDPDECWSECQAAARLLLGEGFEDAIVELSGESPAQNAKVEPLLLPSL